MENNNEETIVKEMDNSSEDSGLNVETKPQKLSNMKKEIIDWALHIVGAVLIALLIVKFVAQVTVVIGSSMEPTLHNYNKLMMEKITPRFGTLKVGDIVVVEAAKELVEHNNTASHSPLIKRVVGVEGDRVKVLNGKVYVNGEEKKENYINGDFTYIDSEDEGREVIVPKDSIYVMGDNRPQGGSIDSRILGTFNKDRVLGRVIVRLFPFDEFGGLSK
jgi:signal peptidase I